MLIERKNKISSEIPSASMADIAFLLLVFFLTTTVFNEEKGLELVLPEAKAQEIQVSQNANSRIVLKKGKNPEEQPISIDGLSERMRQEITLNPKVIAAVKTDPDATYDLMVNVLDELQEAEAPRISLQILQK